MRPRLSLRHLMIASVAVALLGSIAISMRSSARPVFIGPAGPGGSTLTIEMSYEVPFLPILALAVGAWWCVRRLSTRARIASLIGVALGLVAYIQLVLELLRRSR